MNVRKNRFVLATAAPHSDGQARDDGDRADRAENITSRADVALPAATSRAGEPHHHRLQLHPDTQGQSRLAYHPSSLRAYR